MDDKILTRIQKCLDLGKSDNPNEAAAALAMAQKLMEAHGVDAVGVRMASVMEESFTSGSSVTKPKTHELILVQGIAEAFGCKVLWLTGGSYSSGHFSFIGLKSQVPVAVYTSTFLLRRMKKARVAYMATLAERGFVGRQATGDLDAFCRGWARSVLSTVHKFSGSSPELDEAIDAFAKGQLTGDKIAKPSKRKDFYLDSAIAGEEAARGESLHRPMGADVHGQIGQTLKIK